MITNTNFHYLYRLGKRIRPLFQNKSRFYPRLNKSDKSSKVNDQFSLKSHLEIVESLINKAIKNYPS